MNIQTIIDKLKKEYPQLSECNFNGCQLEDAIKQSLTSMLDGIEKEAKDLDCYTQTTLSSGKKVNLVSKEEVINICQTKKSKKY